jgi:hypothetical protein
MIDKNSVIDKQILKDEINLEVAFETWKAFSPNRIYNQIQKNFVAKLKEQINNELKSKLNLENAEIEFLDKSEANRINIQWLIQKKSWNDKFKFGIYDYDNDRLHFSIDCVSKNGLEKQTTHSLLKELLIEGYGYENHWWNRVKEPYNRWESNFDGLKQFAFCDRMAMDYFTNKICFFVEIVDQKLENN